MLSGSSSVLEVYPKKIYSKLGRDDSLFLKVQYVTPQGRMIGAPSGLPPNSIIIFRMYEYDHLDPILVLTANEKYKNLAQALLEREFIDGMFPPVWELKPDFEKEFIDYLFSGGKIPDKPVGLNNPPEFPEGTYDLINKLFRNLDRSGVEGITSDTGPSDGDDDSEDGDNYAPGVGYNSGTSYFEYSNAVPIMEEKFGYRGPGRILHGFMRLPRPIVDSSDDDSSTSTADIDDADQPSTYLPVSPISGIEIDSNNIMVTIASDDLENITSFKNLEATMSIYYPDNTEQKMLHVYIERTI